MKTSQFHELNRKIFNLLITQGLSNAEIHTYLAEFGTAFVLGDSFYQTLAFLRKELANAENPTDHHPIRDY